MKTINLTLANGFICFILMSGCNNDIDPNPSTLDEINKQDNIEYLQIFSKEFSAYFPEKEEIEWLDFLNSEEKKHLHNLNEFFIKTTQINPNISTSEFSSLINEIEGYVDGLNLKTELSLEAPRSPRDLIRETLINYCAPQILGLVKDFDLEVSNLAIVQLEPMRDTLIALDEIEFMKPRVCKK